MTHLAATNVHQPDDALTPWLVVPLVCAVMLMVCTVSSVGDRRADLGTVPLLPPIVLELSKVAARGVTILAAIASVPFLCRHPRFRPVVVFMLPWLTLGGWCVASTLWSPLKQISLFQSGSFLAVLLMATMLGVVASGPRDLSRVVLALTLTLLSICAGLLALRVGLPQVGALSRTALGMFHSTNAGCTAGLGLVMLVAARTLFDWPWTRRLLLPGLLVFVTVLLVANNRMSIMLATALTTALWAVFGNRLGLALAVLAGSVSVAAYLAVDPGLELVTAATGSAGDYVLQGQSNEELGSFSGRTEMWAAIGNSIQQSPWIGHGYFVTSARGEMFVWHDWHNWTAHNLMLQLAATTGFVGVGLFLGSLLWTVATLVQRYMLVPTQRPAILFCAAIGVWWCGWGLLNESIFGPQQPETVVFGLVLAVAATVAATPIDAPRPLPVPHTATLQPSI
jgi:O-antigen ligase